MKNTMAMNDPSTWPGYDDDAIDMMAGTLLTVDDLYDAIVALHSRRADSALDPALPTLVARTLLYRCPVCQSEKFVHKAVPPDALQYANQDTYSCPNCAHDPMDLVTDGIA